MPTLRPAPSLRGGLLVAGHQRFLDPTRLSGPRTDRPIGALR